jgi:hypothetical protein
MDTVKDCRFHGNLHILWPYGLYKCALLEEASSVFEECAAPVFKEEATRKQE